MRKLLDLRYLGSYENFKIMKIDYEFAYKRDPKGDPSPSSIVIDNITERYTWDEALKEYDSALGDASSASSYCQKLCIGV